MGTACQPFEDWLLCSPNGSALARQGASFRFPGCFYEADEGVESAWVSAPVQMLISMLQRDGATPGTSDERGAQRGY
ncbi:Protein phosphatase 1 regulatory subunit 26 [Plecturocebus cupreus]